MQKLLFLKAIFILVINTTERLYRYMDFLSIILLFPDFLSILLVHIYLDFSFILIRKY